MTKSTCRRSDLSVLVCLVCVEPTRVWQSWYMFSLRAVHQGCQSWYMFSLRAVHQRGCLKSGDEDSEAGMLAWRLSDRRSNVLARRASDWVWWWWWWWWRSFVVTVYTKNHVTSDRCILRNLDFHGVNLADRTHSNELPMYAFKGTSPCTYPLDQKHSSHMS